LGSVAGAALAGAAAGAPAAGLRALRSGWTDVLATAPPVPADEARLPVVVVTVAVGAVAAVALARGRRPALALLPAVAVLLVGLALGAGAPGGATAAVPPAAVAAVHLVVVAPAARRLPALAVGAVAVLAGALLGPLLTSGPEADPRALVDPPVETVAAPAPLAVLPARLSASDTRLFTATVDAAWLASPRNWRQVVLEDFDGVTWSARAEPVRIGTRVPGDHPPGPLSRSTVVVERLDGPWVPTTGDPVSVERGDLAAVPGTSVLLDPEGVHDRYTVDSVLPQPDAAALDRAALPALQGGDPSLAVPPCLPEELRTFASDAVAGVSGPGRQAVALEQAFAAMTASSDVDPGHSCGRFPALLEDRRGTSEQFAPAYVLAARSIGLPARLAVGFRPGRIVGGSTTVLSGDALAWPEVRFAGLGWVPFDPTPRELTEEGVRQELPALTEIRRQVAGEPAPVEGVPPPPARVAPPVEEPSTPWLLLAVTAAGLVAAGLAVRPLHRALRRRRRRRAEPRAAVLGAWLETLDALGADRARTPAQVLARTDVPAPASRPLAVVGGLADLAAYGPDAPGPEQVEAAWAAHARVRREVRRGRRRRRGPQPGAPPRTHTGST
ncbi:MAG TPA: transglutaminaseTgpA domain-containing protein, partial [Mycobacteriales bacterium]|nr:transglutaminaseTgpA domain-containing protein [Mycobacteriales bacterium]